jgi:hypothetical protein
VQEINKSRKESSSIVTAPVSVEEVCFPLEFADGGSIKGYFAEMRPSLAFRLFGVPGC